MSTDYSLNKSDYDQLTSFNAYRQKSLSIQVAIEDGFGWNFSGFQPNR